MAQVTVAEIDTAIQKIVVGGVKSVKLSNGVEYTKLTLAELRDLRLEIKSIAENNEGGVYAQNVEF